MTLTLPELLVVLGTCAAFIALFVAGYLRQPTVQSQEDYAMNWLHFAEKILPVALAFVPGMPPGLGQSVANTMIAVESMPGKSGAEKKAIVMDQAITQLQNVNVVAGKTVVDVASVSQALDKGIDAGVAAVNAVQAAHAPAPAASPTAPPVA
jgi:hypothetical protein